MMTDKN